ncbi:hypothetical protein BGX29_006275 [Mortierella sp. GBA35]|nr:hypothetical protein BGX29_006275 [Mortierella sp. GBA35]
MRIISLSLGLAAIALVSAQADPLAATGAHPTYEWSAAGSEKEQVAQLENAAHLISEFEFRSQFLNHAASEIAPASVAGDMFSVKEAVCTDATTQLTTLLDAVPVLINNILKYVPVIGGSLAGLVTEAITPLKDLIKHTTQGGYAVALSSISFTITTAIDFLETINQSGLDGLINPAISALQNILKHIRTLVICASGFGGLATIEKETCVGLADAYRNAMAGAIKSFPAVPSADEKTMDLQRYMGNSIAATNEALLDMRPIFAASVLEKYRLEIVRSSGGNKDAMNYAVSELAAEEMNEYEDIDEDEDKADEDEDEEADEAAPEALAPA